MLNSNEYYEMQLKKLQDSYNTIKEHPLNLDLAFAHIGALSQLVTDLVEEVIDGRKHHD